MKSMVKNTALLLSILLLCAVSVQAECAVVTANADTIKTSSTVATNTNSEDTDVFIPNEQEKITVEQIREVQKLALAVRFQIEGTSMYFDDPSFAKDVTTNMDQRGKAGLTAKVAAKVLKAGLNKMGKKGYTMLAEKTGLKAIGLNWTVINSIADVLAGWSGRLETGIKSALTKCGFNNYWAGVGARLITVLFF